MENFFVNGDYVFYCLCTSPQLLAQFTLLTDFPKEHFAENSGLY